MLRGLRVILGAVGVVEFTDTEHCDRLREDVSRVFANLGAVVGEVGHVSGETATHPVEMPGMVGVGNSRGKARELEALCESCVEECLRIQQHSVIIVPCGWLWFSC